MKRNFRRITSVILTAAMTASLFTGTSWAETKQLFKSGEKPRLVLTGYDGDQPPYLEDGYLNTKVILATDANAALIASDSDALEWTASPSNALLPSYDWDGANQAVYLDASNLKISDVFKQDWNVKNTASLSVSAGGTTYTGKVDYIRNWFTTDKAKAVPPSASFIDFTACGEDSRYDTWAVSNDWTIKMWDGTDKTQEIDDPNQYMEFLPDEPFRFRLHFESFNRTEAHEYLIELYDGAGSLRGYCVVPTLPAPTIQVNTSTVEGQGLSNYIEGLSPDEIKQVESLTLDNGVLTSDDWMSIKKLTSLKTLTVGEGVSGPSYSNSIPADAFKGMTALETVSITAPKDSTRSSISSNPYDSIGNHAFQGCTALKTVTLSGITSLGGGVFQDCTSLSDIKMPDVSSIRGSSAFQDCTSLSNIEMPNISSIRGSSVFQGCTSLKEIKLGRVTGLPSADHLFSGCTSLETVYFPGNFYGTLANDTFENCTSLKKLVLPSSPPSFESNAQTSMVFSGMKLPLVDYEFISSNGNVLTGSELNQAIRRYSDIPIWRDVLGLEAPVLPDTMEVNVTIGGNTETVTGHSLDEICGKLNPKDVTELIITKGQWSSDDWNTLSRFENLEALAMVSDDLYISGLYPENFQLPDTLKLYSSKLDRVPENMFRNHPHLEYAYFPYAVSVGPNAFRDCTNLSKVLLPFVQTISDSAFQNCGRLSQIYLPQNPPTLGSYVFDGCTSAGLKGFHIPYNDISYYKESLEGQWNIWLRTSKPDTPQPGPTPSPSPAPIPSSNSDEGSNNETGKWILDSKGWWFQRDNGYYPYSQWCELPYNGKYDWYYFDKDGYMMTGWYTDQNGSTYYLNPVSDGTRGRMFTGWNQIDGKWYYFSTEPGSTQGALLKNTVTPDGYTVDADGVWVQ